MRHVNCRAGVALGRLREVIEILSLKASERGIALNYPEHAPIWVEMDLERIEQVLVNLIENAIKFSHRDSRIEIDTEIEAERIRVSVRDYGIGIASVFRGWFFDNRFDFLRLVLAIMTRHITFGFGELVVESLL